jgi:uncharacterized protein (TIGR04255 family)
LVTKAELDEIFPRPSVREVAFEVRFAPRLRVVPEVWRIQDGLAEDYPRLLEEDQLQPEGRSIHFYTFTDSAGKRTIKVSQENFLVIANQYIDFESFKAEALKHIKAFAALFEIKSFNRIGLRYINHIELPGDDVIDRLQELVRAPIDFTRFDSETIEQFMTEFRLKAEEDALTVRGALLAVPGKPQSHLYILDLDCYSLSGSVDSLEAMIDRFHHQIQVHFLEHITENYKNYMRAR